MIDLLKPVADRVEKRFREVAMVPWRPKGILLSEGLAFCMMAEAMEVHMIIESGIGNGRSARIWRAYFPAIAIAGIDWEFPEDAPADWWALDIPVHRCAARDTLPNLVEHFCHRGRLGIFIDGPKGQAAIDLAVECMAFDHVKFVGVHDLSWVVNHAERKAFNELRHQKWCTDSQSFVELYSYLDVDDSQWDDEQGTRWFPYWRFDRGKEPTPRGSYGYTIGFLYK